MTEPSAAAATSAGGAPQRPTITVVMAAYNAAATIGGSLSSVFTQEYPGVDVVVVDDGSSDGTAAVVQGYADAGFPVRLVRQENRGASEARTVAIAEATGDLVAILDSDDELLPGYFDVAVSELRAGDERTWVSLDAYLLTPGGFDPRRTVLQLGAPAPQEQERAILGANFVSIFSVFPRAMAQEIGSFRSELPACEDWDVWARAIALGWRVRIVRTPMALYRWSPGSLSTAFEKMSRGEMMVLEHVRSAYGDRLAPENRAYLDERIAAGSLLALRKTADDALRAGDTAAARHAYGTVARLAPADRKSALKAKTLGNPVGDRFWRRRLAAADAATGRKRVGR